MPAPPCVATTRLGKTIVVAKKVRRQPMCGAPGQVEFWFMAQERRLKAVAGSDRALGQAA